MQILEFLMRHEEIFTAIDDEYWDGYFTIPSQVGDGGYVLVNIEDDELFHTYRYPPDWVGL